MKTLKQTIGLICLFSILSLKYADAQIGNTNTGNGSGSGTGNYNSAFGDNTLHNITSGSNNSAVGAYALYMLTVSVSNDAFGDSALYSDNGTSTSGVANGAFGEGALMSNTTGYQNVGIGYHSLGNNTTANGNVAVGFQALLGNTTGNGNTAVGQFALNANDSGGPNDAVGHDALYVSTSAHNAAFGFNSLWSTTTGGNNSAFGYKAGLTNSTGFDNTFIGYQADANGGGLSGSTAIGYSSIVTGNNTVYIGNGAGTIGGPVAWSVISDGRFKENVKEDVPGISFIMKLRPVTYNLNWRKHDLQVLSTDTLLSASHYDMLYNIKQTGFIAQEVEKAAQEVDYDFHGVDKPQNDKSAYGLRYSEFVVPLVKAVQEQQTMIDSQATIIKALEQTLAQQQEVMSTVLTQLQDIKNCCNNGSDNTAASQSSRSNGPQLIKAVPNPTSDLTAIYYFVPQTANSAKIQLTDANGQVLQTINAGNLGYSSITLQTNNLSGGTYLYSLIVDDQLIDTKKLVVALK